MACYGQQLLARVVDLQCGVLDPETLSEHLFERAADAMAVSVGRDQHVRGEDRVARCEFPQVQVVHLTHVLGVSHRPADLSGNHLLRRALEQHADGFALEAEPGSDHQASDEERGDRVCSIEACDNDHESRDQRADECI